MKKALLLCSALLFILGLAAGVCHGEEDEPEYVHILFGPDQKLIFDTAPNVYLSIYTSVSNSGLLKLKDPGETRKLLADSKIVKVVPDDMRKVLEKFAKDHEVKFIIAQSMEGRYDHGGIYTWLMEDGKWQINGKWTSVNTTDKPALGAMDTMLAMTLLAFETSSGSVSRVMELEKYGALQAIIEGYRILNSKGIIFSRGYYLQSMEETIKLKLKEAKDYAVKAIELDPFWPPNYEALGQVATETGQNRMYIARLEEGLKLYPDNLGLIIIRVNHLDLKVEELKVQKLLAKARQIDPGNPGLIELEVKFALERKDFVSVPKLIKRYFKTENTTLKMRCSFGLKIAQILVEKGEYSPATSIYQTILDSSPQSSIYLEKAKCHKMMGDISGKLSSEISAFSLMPDEDLTWSIVDGARDSNEVETTLEKIIIAADNNQNDPVSRYTLGLLYILQKNLPEALKMFDQAIELSEDGRLESFYRLVAVAGLGDIELEFRKEITGYSKEHGTHPDMKAVGSLLVRLLLFDRGEFFLRTELDKAKPNFDALSDLGICYIQMENYKMFKKVFNAMQKIENKKPPRWGLLLSVWYGQKRKDKILEQLLEVVKQIRDSEGTGPVDRCYRFSLFKHNLMDKLNPDQQFVVKTYYDFLDDNISSGTLAHRLTSRE